MIQVILNSGKCLRFIGPIVGVNETDIMFQKELTKEEELLRPIKTVNGIEFVQPEDLLLYEVSIKKE